MSSTSSWRAPIRLCWRLSLQPYIECWVRAHDLSTIEHIRTQATFQSFIDGGISKTINLPGSNSQADIARAILEARARGCVGISLYRDGSIEDQLARLKT